MITFDGKYEYPMQNEINRLINLKKEALEKQDNELYKYVIESSKNIFKNHPLSIREEDWQLIDTQSKKIFCDLKLKQCDLLGNEEEKKYWINIANNNYELPQSIEPLNPVMIQYMEEKRKQTDILDNEVRIIKQGNKKDYDALSRIEYQYKEIIDEIERIITLKSVTTQEKNMLRELIQEIENKAKNIQPSQEEIDAIIGFG